MKEHRLLLYFKKPVEQNKWFLGDKYIRYALIRLIRGKPKVSGVEKVFINLCKGFDLIKQPYVKNLSFDKITEHDKIVILGVGKSCLEEYNSPNKIIAGIGLMTHPSEWPNLCEKYPIAKYLQHSEWANNLYKPYYGNKCAIWSVGIDTNYWVPSNCIKKYDILIYNKVHWNYSEIDEKILQPIKKIFEDKKLNFIEIRYGHYKSEDYKTALSHSKSMLFMCEHESQGIAYQEALSMNIPILAWDEGRLIDPNYKIWKDENMPTTSVPYFDQRCGMKFNNLEDFKSKFSIFFDKVDQNLFSPREYVLENLTLEKSATRMLEIIQEVYG